MKKAFTVLELLVAMAVLALILAVMLQITNGILRATLTQNQQLDATAAARRALDILGTDLERAIVGPNSALLVPNSATNRLLSFLTSRGGPGTANHRFLAVSYATNANHDLQRLYASIPYADANLPLACANATFTTPAEPLASGILAFDIRALADGGTSYPVTNAASAHWATNSYNGLAISSAFKALLTPSASFAGGLTNRTRALEIWIASIDPQNLRLLQSSSQLASLIATLRAKTPSEWRTTIDDATNIPPVVKSGIRIQKKSLPAP